MIFINFKTYEQSSGQNASELIRAIEEVSSEHQVKVIPVIQALDLKEAISMTPLEIWVQNVDPVTYGAHTGAIIPQEVKEAGAGGTFINHSENKVESLEELKQTIQICKEVGLKTLVFAADINELKQVLEFKPTYAAYEPPQLIGSTTTSVAQAEPEIIKEAADIARDYGIPLIVGAGVHSQDDVRESLKLGAVGFALATDVVKAEDPKKELLDLIEGYSQV